MKPLTEAELVDYLGGELPPGRHAEVEAALASDPALAEELAELSALMAAITAAPEPAPSATADARFADLLHGAVGEAKVRTLPNRNWLRYAAAAAAILFIFAAGWYTGGAEERALKAQLAATRTQVETLMQDARPSARIKATTVTFDLPQADPTTVRLLGYLLRTDESTNVRLAALDALRRFPNDLTTRDQLLSAMEENPPEVVRVELINHLVDLKEKRVLPYLQDIIEADSLPQPLRDAAELASFKLI
ncbi:MAG: HEAT repeat domain-containing protein [Bacteroidota bacterium]